MSVPASSQVGMPVTVITDAGGGGGGSSSSSVEVIHGVTDAPTEAPDPADQSAFFVGPDGTLYSWNPDTAAWLPIVSNG